MRHGMLVILALLFVTPAFADPPSDASLEELFSTINAQQMFGAANKQMDALIQNSVRQASDGEPMTPQRQAIIDRMVEKMSAAAKQAISWDSLKPILVRVYQETFSQEDVDAMLSFYRSPAGQNMLQKMPLAMQNVMTEMQAVMKPMQDKMRQVAREAQQELQQLKSSPVGADRSGQ